LIVAVDSTEKTLEIVQTARKHFPHLKILSRARGRPAAYELLDAGVEHVYRETVDTSLRLGVDALCVLGYRKYQALRAARKFRRYDEASVRELAGMRKDQKAYILRARELIRSLEELIRAEVEQGRRPEQDLAWDATSLRREYGDPDE
jgi:voltage-gated potassium channel Kch